MLNIDKTQYEYAFLNENLTYSPEKGEFFFKKTQSRYRSEGDKVKLRTYYGNSTLMLLKKMQLNAFIVAYVLQTKKFPQRRVGPINLDYSDLRWENIDLFYSNHELFSSREKITWEELHRAVNYNPKTGDFTAKISFCRTGKGSILTKVGQNGYNVVRLNNKNYNAGRLAYFYMRGIELPKDKKIQRIDKNTLNDKWENLEVK